MQNVKIPNKAYHFLFSYKYQYNLIKGENDIAINAWIKYIWNVKYV